jgi:hypothetical protein
MARSPAEQSARVVSRREAILTYVLGGFVISVIVWASIALMRSEGIWPLQ